MHNTLTKEMQARIRHHVDSISVDADLDADIREELYGHFEDRMLEYLSGDEAITEEDAFQLVSDRFGAPDRVEAGLRETHERTPAGTLFRRIGTVLAATIVVEMLLPVGEVLADHFGNISRTLRGILMFLWVLWPVMTLYLLWIVLRRMRERAHNPGTPWYLRLGAIEFILLITGLLFLQQVLPTVHAYFRAVDLLWRDNTSMVYTRNIRGILNESIPILLGDQGFMGIEHWMRFWMEMVINMGSLFYFSLLLYMWLWWCDSPLASLRRRLVHFTAAIAVWTGYTFAVYRIIPRAYFFQPHANYFQHETEIATGIGWPHLLYHGSNAFPPNYIMLEWMMGMLMLGTMVATTYIVITTSWRLATRKEQFRLTAVK